MNVWLLKDGEHLPVQAGARPMRMWLLANALRARGHQVTWWASTFSHQRKTLLATSDVDWTTDDGIRLRLLQCGAYSRNVSWARYRHHRRLAARFAAQARAEQRPDVIVAAYPIIELARAAVDYGAHQGVPVVVDVRDLWPDVFVDKAPPAMRPVVRGLVRPLERSGRATLHGAAALIGVSPSYLDWALERARRSRTDRDATFYLGCDDPGIHDADRRSPGRLTCVFVGSFGLSYDLESVCDAAAIVGQQRGSAIRFVLAGAGDQFERIARRARSLPNVETPGWIGGVALRQLLRDADIALSPVKSIVHPSTLSNKIFEYLATGLPIVSSVEGETTALLEEHDVGLAYQRGNARALAEAILRLADDEALRNRQGRNARALFERQFRADLIYRNYAHHLEAVAADWPSAK